MKKDTYDYDTGGDLMGELKFQKLTPTQEADLSGYEDAFHYIFAEDDIRNIAISGAYSSGKSSVIESYKKKHPDKKFLHLSLAHFQALDDGSLEENDSEDNTKMTAQEDVENIIEGKILNQLIQQIPAEKIPQTNFRIKTATNRAFQPPRRDKARDRIRPAPSPAARPCGAASARG